MKRTRQAINIFNSPYTKTLALFLTFFVFSMLLLHGSVSAGNAKPQIADNEKILERIYILEKELAVLKETTAIEFNAQDKRISDFSVSTNQQANHLAAISNKTSTVSNFIAVTSVLITVIVFIAGFVTYLSAKARAEYEARKAAQKWFKDSSKELIAEIENLRAKAGEATNSINEHTNRVKDDADKACESINDITKSAEKEIFKDRSNIVNESAKESIEVAALRDSSRILRAKPENEFTAQEHYLRGLDLFSSKDFHSALNSFEQAFDLLENEEKTDNTMLSKLILARAYALGELGRSEEAISVYDELDERFGKDSSPTIKEMVANSLYNKGVRLRELGRLEEEISAYDELDERFGKDSSPTLREQIANGLFNKGVTLGKLGRPEGEISAYDELDERFGKDSSPALRKLIAEGLINKGVTLGRLDRSEEAISVFNVLDERFGKDSSPTIKEKVAKGLHNKGVSLGQLGRLEEAISVFNELIQRFGNDTWPAAREVVAMGHNSSGFNKIMLAKKNWHDCEKRNDLLNDTLNNLAKAKDICAKDYMAMILGNIGYASFLLDNKTKAEEETRECLVLGKTELFEAQLKDANADRIEPIDTEYENMLRRLWDEISATS